MNGYNVVKTVNNVTSTYEVMNPTKKIDMGSLSYSYVRENNQNVFYASIADIAPVTNTPRIVPAWSDLYTAVRQDVTPGDLDMKYRSNAAGSRVVMFVNNYYTSAASFKTAMTGRTLTYVTSESIVPYDVAKEG